ncbi:M99 family carboxypeptidase catalytic domain-containing protein [Helicobacter brantae]|nr:M99 family carboxypeptidase catalytic domain-containing protein [Helicobacter brantae]
MKKILLYIGMCLLLSANILDFDLVKMPSQKEDSPRVLLIGGIQGDEPGGFNALNLFLQHYKILKGEVWVIPNLNRHSILRNHRGIYGDMNRKFKTLSKNDPEYSIIERLKSIVLHDKIDFIFHLHDGSGFYRETYISKELNPSRWGNCSIIDQEKLKGAKYGNLLEYSQSIVKYVNASALKDLHLYHIRNTHTAKEDKEMEKSLTFFAVRNQKGALANEASKNLPLNERVYYHLLAVEGILKTLGVEFKRDFKLTPRKILEFINDSEAVVQITPLITLPVMGLKKSIAFFPLPSKEIAQIPLSSTHYIMGLLPKNQDIVLKYGNKIVTQLSPFVIEFEKSAQKVQIQVDHRVEEVRLGSIIKVKKSFKVLPSNLRVNVIGFTPKGRAGVSEANYEISLANLIKKYSIDTKERQYRIEFYNGRKFAGMIIVEFEK